MRIHVDKSNIPHRDVRNQDGEIHHQIMGSVQSYIGRRTEITVASVNIADVFRAARSSSISPGRYSGDGFFEGIIPSVKSCSFTDGSIPNRFLILLEVLLVD